MIARILHEGLWLELDSALGEDAFLVGVLDFAHRAIGAESYSRVDFRVDSHESPWLIEINTLPGLTNLSYLPKMAAHVSLAYADLIDESPAAYKDIDAVMAAQADLVEIVHTLRQVVCVKG